MKLSGKACSIVAVLLLGAFASAVPAAAQSQACVSLLVGAGYAAEMNVTWSGGSTGWSSSFPIGQTKCQSLEGVPTGTQYTVKVYAILGKTQNCSPSLTKVSGGPNAVFQAWGTTLNVKCEMPGSSEAQKDSAAIEKASKTPSPAGAAAAKKAKANGDKVIKPPDEKDNK